MRDILEIGPTPCDETCQQLGHPDYDAAEAKAECRRFIDCIRQFCGPEPPGANLVVRGNAHDFGTYYEVAVRFDDDDETAAGYAYHVEGHAPQTWDGAGASLYQPDEVPASPLEPYYA